MNINIYAQMWGSDMQAPFALNSKMPSKFQPVKTSGINEDAKSPDVLIIFCFKNSTALPCEVLPWLNNSPQKRDFIGKTNELALIYNPQNTLPARIMLVGLGEAEKFNLHTLRMASATALRKCSALNLKSAGIWVEQFACLSCLNTARNENWNEQDLLFEAALGAAFSLYSYNKFHTVNKERASSVSELALVCLEPEHLSFAQNTAIQTQALAAGMALTKDLANGPPNVITPAAMEECAADLARRLGFKISVLREHEIKSLGMGAYAAVCQGSKLGGRLIILDYAPPGCEATAPITFVGKGLTFDSGGISIKPSAGMHEMKSDMAGAAAVLGMCEAIGRLGCPRRVVAMLACAENMPDGGAMRPGDIVTSLSGQTIEIINTDAEGRLVLCDALTYAEQIYQPAALIDIATLTGACRVALGSEVAGMFCTNEEFQTAALEYGMQSGDKCWPLPVWDEFFENMKSPVADMSNAGPREGGAINAALFLKQFVNKNTPWMHLDIAGPAYMEKGNALREPGATGFGMRLLFNIAMHGTSIQGTSAQEAPCMGTCVPGPSAPVAPVSGASASQTPSTSGQGA